MLSLYRLLLRAYPREFRREYGAEMSAAVAAAWQTSRARGWRERLRMTRRLAADWLVSLPAAWRGRPRPVRPRQKKDPMLTTLIREVRFAGRSLWHTRWSTAATVITLALAIGATAAVFSVVRAVVLRPLPYASPDRLVAIWEHNVVRNRPRNLVAPANFMEWRDRAQSFQRMAGVIDSSAALTGDGPAEQIDFTYVSWDLFDMLGVRAALGDTFRVEDSAPNSPRKALLSWALWQRRYHGDPAVVGRSIQMDGQAVGVIGVLPASFRLLGRDPDVIWQIRYSAATREPRGRSWTAIAQLKPGITVETARAEMSGIAAALEQKWPAFDTGWRVTVTALGDDLNGDVRIPLLLMLAAVGIVLLAGCANTTNLLLARASARRRDTAVRTALGASRWQLTRQFLAEGALVAAAGAAAGLALARLSLLGVSRFSDRVGIPRLDEASLDWPVLLFSLGVMAGCAMLFSLIPALHLRKGEVGGALSSGGRWSTGQRGERRVRQVLVTVQVGAAVVLLIGGGLVTRSLQQLVSVNPGFDRRVYSFSVALPDARYATPERQLAFYDDLTTRLRTTPGIEAAGFMTFLPFKSLGTATSFTRVDQPPPPAGQEPVADIRPVDDAFFGVMRVPVLQGRTFTSDEVRREQKVCVISAATARAVFGDENPLGKWLNIHLNGGPDQIIGVVDDIHISALRETPRPLIYYPYARFPLNFVSVVMRGGLSDTAMHGTALSLVGAIDKDIPVTDSARLGQNVDDSVASPAAAAQLVGSFAVLALVLSLVGVAALLAAVVANRVPEFGVRLALGATPGDIRRLVLVQGAWMIGAGLTIGLALSLAASQSLATVLYGVRPIEPVIYAGALGVIAVLGLLAADVPARRATRVNPVDILR